MALKKVLGCVLVTGLLWIVLPGVSLDEDVRQETWQKFYCFEGRLPDRESLDMFPQVFVSQSEITEGLTLDIHVSQFPEYSEQDEADIICSSSRFVQDQIPARMPCPFLHGNQEEVNVHWTFEPGPHSPPPLDAFQDPAKRAQGKFLFLGYLKHEDEGLYNCTATAGQQVWSEISKLTKLERGWRLDWTGPYANHKSYILASSRSPVNVKAFEAVSWLEEDIEAVEERL